MGVLIRSDDGSVLSPDFLRRDGGVAGRFCGGGGRTGGEGGRESARWRWGGIEENWDVMG